MGGLWGQKSRHCLFCGKVGPRVQYNAGWAHRRCIPKPLSEVKRPETNVARTEARAEYGHDDPWSGDEW